MIMKWLHDYEIVELLFCPLVMIRVCDEIVCKFTGGARASPQPTL